MAESNDKQRKRRGPRKATAKYLENAALYYLQRFSSSAANLRRVMIRKVEKSAHYHGTEPDEGAALVDAMIERYLSSGLLDDAILMGCDETQVRDVLAAIIKSIDNPFKK